MNPDNELFSKFHNNRLSTDELQRLREQVNRMSDEEIELRLLDTNISHRNDIHINMEEKENLRERLVAEARKSNMRYRLLRRINIAAAAVVVALITVSAVLGLRVSDLSRYRTLISRENIVATAIGEELMAVLPDGSRVKMAPMSELRYSLDTFNGDERNVSWIGEGTFEVARDETSPFTVHAGNFDVRVLGTTFSIDVRKDNTNSFVYLSSGSIELSVDGERQRHRLVPGDLATINRTSGAVAIDNRPDFKMSTSDIMLNFYNIPLSDVLTQLEYYYPRKFEAPEELLNETFAGALPKNNMFEAVTILEKVYGMYSVTDSATVAMELRR